MKLWRFYKKVISFSFAQMTIFRGSFLIFIGWLLLDALIKIFVFYAIFHQVKTIGGWTFQDSILLVFFLSLIWDLAWTFFLTGFDRFTETFSRGSFDFVLLKPLDPLLYLTLTGFSISSFSGIRNLIIIYFAIFIPFAWQLSNILLAVLFLILALTILHAIYAILSALCFWIVEAQEIVYFLAHIVEGARYPQSIYSATARFIFTFIFPIIVIANFPVMSLKGLMTWQTVVLTIITAIIFQVVAHLIWRIGVRRYSSASS